MAETKDIIIGTLALVGGAYLVKAGVEYAVGKLMDNISYIKGRPTINLDNIAQGYINITLPVTVLNQNPFNIHIDHFFADVDYGAVWLGKVMVVETFDLMPDEAITINITFSVHIPNAINGIFTAASQGGFSALLNKIYLKGNLAVFGNSFLGQINIPVETEISLI